jgi:hypothetical protein
MRRKPERIESVAMRPAVIAQAVSREDEEDWASARVSGRESGREGDTSQQRRQESERRRRGACLRDDFMQRAAGKPAMRQMAVDGGKPERNGGNGANPFHFRQ